MKKNYITLLVVFACTFFANAQFFTTDFSEASYDAPAAQALLNDHADWVSQAAWRANAVDQVLIDNANWRKVVLDKKVNASSGDYLSAEFNIVIGRDTDAFTGDGTLIWLGFKSTNNTTDWHNREGITISRTGGNFVFASQSSNDNPNSGPGGANGSSAISPNPSVTATVNTVHNVKIEIGVGADAASSTLSVRVDGGTIGSTTGIDPELYTDITTPANGVYFWSWAYAWTGTGISAIFFNDLKVDNTTTILSVDNPKNAFEFAMYPNPVKEQLQIRTQEPIKKLQVLDLLGKEVLSQDNVFDAVDVSSLKSALYIVKLTSDKGISTSKFVKE